MVATSTVGMGTKSVDKIPISSIPPVKRNAKKKAKDKPKVRTLHCLRKLLSFVVSTDQMVPISIVGLPEQRPLSAYNFFFKEEREKIIKIVNSENPFAKDIQPDKDAEDYLDEEAVGRLKKEGGKISFEEMGKIIGARWKNIDPDRLGKYSELAAEDTERYKNEMQAYNGRQEAKMRSEAMKPAVPYSVHPSVPGVGGSPSSAVGSASAYSMGASIPGGYDMHTYNPAVAAMYGGGYEFPPYMNPYGAYGGAGPYDPAGSAYHGYSQTSAYPLGPGIGAYGMPGGVAGMDPYGQISQVPSSDYGNPTNPSLPPGYNYSAMPPPTSGDRAVGYDGTSSLPGGSGGHTSQQGPEGA